MNSMNEVIDAVLAVAPVIRYVAIRRGGEAWMRQRPGLSNASESESDRYGVNYMTQAGYDPRGMIKVMEILRDASKGGRGWQITQTHPNPEARLQDLTALLKQKYPSGVPSTLTEGDALPK